MDFQTHILFEASQRHTLVSVDIQPAYDTHCRRILPQYIEFLNSYKGNIVCFYNGPQAGLDDTQQTVASYYYENGLAEEKLDQIIWKEKYYAFFRNWMDLGVDRDSMIKAIRFMVLNRIHDSREVPREQWQLMFKQDSLALNVALHDDEIHIPDVSIAELKTWQGCYLCGGAANECLSEFRLLFEAFNINYKLVKSLIY